MCSGVTGGKTVGKGDKKLLKAALGGGEGGRYVVSLALVVVVVGALVSSSWRCCFPSVW